MGEAGNRTGKDKWTVEWEGGVEEGILGGIRNTFEKVICKLIV